MKNKILSLILIISIFSPLNLFAFSAEEKYVLNDETEKIEKIENTSVKISESSVIRDFDDKMSGLCWEFQDFSDDNIMNNTTEISNEYKQIASKLKNAFSLARVFGAPSSYYFYSDNVGEYKNRKSRKLKKYLWDVGDSATMDMQNTHIGTFGPAEWVKAAYEINPDTEFIVTLNIMTADTEETKKTAAFFTAPEGTLIDGVDYGKIRTESGIDKPVKVAMYELGNEIPWVYKDCDPKSYIKTIKEHMAAVREIDPEAKFAYCGAMVQNWATGPDGMDWRQWTYDVYPDIADDCEYVTFHPYHSGTGLATYDKYFDHITNDQLAAAGKTAKIVFTEVAKWPDLVDGTSEFGYGFSQDPIALDGALADAIFLNKMNMRTDVYGATYFLSTEYPSGCWGIFKKIDGKLRITGPGYMYALYTKNTGGKVVNSEFSGESELTDIKSDECRFSVLAAKQGKDTLKIILVNRSPYVKQNLSFEFENNYTLTEETIFTAPNINSYVCSEATNDIFTTVTTEKNEKNFGTYEMPNKSMVVLTLKSDKPFEGVEDETIQEETGNFDINFSDMQGHWAAQVVAKMEQQGIICGNGEGLFNPEDSITRAEFAKILACAAGKEIPKTPISLFEDVDINAWYAPYVQAAYAEGLIRGRSGKNYDPDDFITMEELAATVARIKGKNIVVTPEEKENILRGFIYKEEISSWAQSDILIAIKSGCLQGLYENGRFKPSAKVTRAQAAYVISQMYR